LQCGEVLCGAGAPPAKPVHLLVSRRSLYQNPHQCKVIPDPFTYSSFITGEKMRLPAGISLSPYGKPKAVSQKLEANHAV
jgi:hypothetical protein